MVFIVFLGDRTLGRHRPTHVLVHVIQILLVLGNVGTIMYEYRRYREKLFVPYGQHAVEGCLT